MNRAQWSQICKLSRNALPQFAQAPDFCSDGRSFALIKGDAMGGLYDPLLYSENRRRRNRLTFSGESGFTGMSIW